MYDRRGTDRRDERADNGLKESQVHVIEGSIPNPHQNREHKTETMLYGRGNPNRDDGKERGERYDRSGYNTNSNNDNRRNNDSYGGVERDSRRPLPRDDRINYDSLERSERDNDNLVESRYGTNQQENNRTPIRDSRYKLEEDNKERLKRRQEQLDNLRTSPSNNVPYKSPSTLDKPRYPAQISTREREKSRGFDMGLSFTDEKQNNNRSGQKPSATVEPFFGHFKDLKLQRYERFHTKLQDLMKELKVEERSRILPDQREEIQEAELKREWKFIKDIVQNLVQANKRIRELENQVEKPIAPQGYERRRYN